MVFWLQVTETQLQTATEFVCFTYRGDQKLGQLSPETQKMVELSLSFISAFLSVLASFSSKHFTDDKDSPPTVSSSLH